MFEVGKDIFKHGFTGVRGNTEGCRRLRWIYMIFALLFAFFAAQTLRYGIQGMSRTRIAGANGNQGGVPRADIVDRNGDILAKSIEAGHIILRPQKVRKKDKVAELIHEILPEYSLNDALKLVDSSFPWAYIKKNATDAQRDAVTKSGLDGIEIERFQKRLYPKRRLFSHIVGFVNKDGQGAEGAELYYDDYITQNIEPLRLSLDARVQSVFYEQLSLAMEKYQAKGALGMLMNSRTGEMIAMVQLPDFDPENVGRDSVENRRFKPMRDMYEMGSVFKIFNTAMALENGIDKKYYVAAPYKILDKKGRVTNVIHDVSSFKPEHPNFTIDEIMLHSCNVGSVQIALDLPDGTQKEFFQRLHLDEKLNLEFGKTERPLMPIKWGPVERATVSFGHGISVTPMHLMLGVNAMTNGGIFLYPTLRRRDVGAVVGERVLSPEISAHLREIMFQIAEKTTARNVRVPGVKIGGKTGTAEKRGMHGKSDKNRNLTVFAGIFPVDAPQYVIMIFLDEPHATKETFGWKTAAWNAVPTARQIIDSSLPLLFK